MQVCGYAGMQVFSYSGMQGLRISQRMENKSNSSSIACLLVACIQVFVYAGMQVCKYSGLKECRYAFIQLCICRCAGMQVC